MWVTINPGLGIALIAITFVTINFTSTLFADEVVTVGEGKGDILSLERRTIEQRPVPFSSLLNELAAHVSATDEEDTSLVFCLLESDAEKIAQAFSDGDDLGALLVASELIGTERCGRVAGVGVNTRDGTKEACPVKSKGEHTKCVGVQRAYSEDQRVFNGKALYGYVVVTTGYPEPSLKKESDLARWPLAE